MPYFEGLTYFINVNGNLHLQLPLKAIVNLKIIKLCVTLPQPLTPQATHFWVDGMISSLHDTLTPPNSCNYNQNNYKHQANMDI